MERSAIFSPHGIFNVKFNLFQVNDVLVDLGYKALPCPVARVTKRDPEIQQKIMELKRERQQEEEKVVGAISPPNLRRKGEQGRKG